MFSEVFGFDEWEHCTFIRAIPNDLSRRMIATFCSFPMLRVNPFNQRIRSHLEVKGNDTYIHVHIY